MQVIDSDNYAASAIQTMFFPGGEPHARIPVNFGIALLYLKARTWNDVGLGLVVLDALYRQGGSKPWLFVPYFPGARQDRTDYQTPFTADLILDLFKSKCDKIFTFDAHSYVIGKKVNRNFMPEDLPCEFDSKTIVIAPDKGAVDRCRWFASSKGLSSDIILCEKKRNFSTGNFEGFTMAPLPRAGHYLIVDDICDGGGTFNLLADEFSKKRYSSESKLDLWVSHGIFSKGIDNINPLIGKIHTTDSWYKPAENSRVIVHSLQPIINDIISFSKYKEGV